MVLQHTTYKTIDTIGFTNIKEVLDSNTGSVLVTSTFSLNSEIPIIILEIDKSPEQVYQNNYIVGRAKITIRVVYKHKLDAANKAVEIEGLINTALTNLNNVNMQYVEHQSVNLDFERGKERLHGKEIVYLFNVR